MTGPMIDQPCANPHVKPLRTYEVACTLGLEPALEGELLALGASDVKQRRGSVVCRGDQALGYRACLWLRSAVRVLERLDEFAVRTEQELYDRIHALPWEQWLSPDDTLAVDATVRDSVLTHSNYAGIRVKDAIVDRFVARVGRRPSVDRERPTVWVRLRLVKGRATLARDLGGESLHKRGYRPIQVKSPLNEATAAGLLLLAGYDGTGLLVDPMCGSGTFLIEAAWIATDRAPGLDRRFAFTQWPDFDDALWHGIVGQALDRAEAGTQGARGAAGERRAPDGGRDGAGAGGAARFIGIDKHAGALSIARKTIEAAEVGDWVTVQQADAATWEPPRPPVWVFTNPPWGERMTDEVEASWSALADLLRRCPGAQVHVLSGSPELSSRLRMKSDRRWAVRSGQIDCRLLRYPVRAREG